MTDIRRSLRCASCGFESTISLSSEFELHDLMASGKCRRCNSAMQINYCLIAPPSQSTASADPSSVSSSTSSSRSSEAIDLADSIFSSESTSDNIKDLLED